MEIRTKVNDQAASAANERLERSRTREAVPATSFRQVVQEANNEVVRVQRGDTLKSIAKRYGISVMQIAWSNGLISTATPPAGRWRRN